jgi:hypothetical protein
MSGMLPNQDFSRAVSKEREREARGQAEQYAHRVAVASVAGAAEPPRRPRFRGLGRSILGHGHHVSRPGAATGTPATLRPGR